MVRLWRVAWMALGLTLFLQTILFSDLWAFTVVETRNFREGSLTFKIEVQVYGRGNLKKGPLTMSSLKVKIKNEKAGIENLKVKTIRVYAQPTVYMDLETLGYSISPRQWVTKYYRLKKNKQFILGESGYIEIAFENFSILFNPRMRNFQGPVK
jgi:hypothetical protein